MTVSTAATIITPLSTTICQSCQCWGWGEFLPSFSTNFVITTYLQATLHKVPPNYLKPFMGTLWITTVQARTGFSSQVSETKQFYAQWYHNKISIVQVGGDVKFWCIECYMKMMWRGEKFHHSTVQSREGPIPFLTIICSKYFLFSSSYF